MEFYEIHDAFRKKHGNLKCPHCKEGGLITQATHAPCGGSPSRKKQGVCCVKHFKEAEAKTLRHDKSCEPDYSDAAFACGGHVYG